MGEGFQGCWGNDVGSRWSKLGMLPVRGSAVFRPCDRRRSGWGAIKLIVEAANRLCEFKPHAAVNVLEPRSMPWQVRYPARGHVPISADL